MSVFPPQDRFSRCSPWLCPLLLAGCALAGTDTTKLQALPDAPDASASLDSAPPDTLVADAAASDPSDAATPDASGAQDGGAGPELMRDASAEVEPPEASVPEDASAPAPQEDAGEPPDSGVEDSGAPAVPVSDAAPDGGSVEPDAGPDDLGEGDGSDVITIGDSWMRNNVRLAGGGIQGGLERAGTSYRHYGQPLVSLLEDNFAGEAVVNQWKRALAQQAEIETVIMTGGGGEVFTTSECGSAQGCPQLLAELAQGLATLWADMAAAGVRDVIYVAYSSDVGSGVMADVEGNGIAEACRAAPLRCHVLETTDLVDGELRLDGVVPTEDAIDRVAMSVLDLMRDQGMRR